MNYVNDYFWQFSYSIIEVLFFTVIIVVVVYFSELIGCDALILIAKHYQGDHCPAKGTLYLRVPLLLNIHAKA